MKKNCPNCGAPYEVELNKCPYCNTSYYDLSAIDIDGNEPFYLKIKTGNRLITQLVRAKPDISITFQADTTYACNHRGENIIQFINNKTLITNINFEAVLNPKESKTLCTIEVTK